MERAMPVGDSPDVNCYGAVVRMLGLALLVGAVLLGVGMSSAARAAETSDLSIEITSSPYPFILGQVTRITYSIRVINNGPDTAGNVRITFPIPPNTTYSS